MTIEEKRIAQEMYLEGETITSIAKKLHYCPQTISRCLPDESKLSCRRWKNIIYLGIARWLIVNKMTVKELSEKIGTGSKSPHLLQILHGKICPRKTMIDKILAATGLTYEEAFRTEGREQ